MSKPQFHDCGKYGRLTANEAARISGCTTCAIYHRLRSGYSGEHLIDLPRVHRKRSEAVYRAGFCIDPNAHSLMFVACKVASILRKGEISPSVDALQTRFGMSRATAFRWRRAWFDANGLLA